MKLRLFSLLLIVYFLESSSQASAKNFTNPIVLTTPSTLTIELNEGNRPGSQYLLSLRQVQDGSLFFSRDITALRKTTADKKTTFLIQQLRPIPWSPTRPTLYELELTIKTGGKQNVLKKKIGFRDFQTKNGKFYLNGVPIFLKGNAINPPGRGIPDSVNKSIFFAREYLSFLKSIHINIVRFPGNAPDFWYDLCDELGMMVFGGNYSGSSMGEKPPSDYDKALQWYKNEKFGPIAHHPSLMIYTINNETAYAGKKGDAWHTFQDYIYKNLMQWDASRAYISNAGYGFGKTGNVCDLHRYWGWYYNSPYTFLNIRDQKEIIPFVKPKDQPITFTECVGNYIGPDGRYNLTPDNKAPQSQLNWTGHANADLQRELAKEHQALTYKMAIEPFRRMRSLNPDLSGVVPFTILFDNWNTISRFSDMVPKAVTEQAKISFQPVLLSWECWTSHIYSGSTFKAIAHIVNDDENFQDLNNIRLTYFIRDKANNELKSASITIPEVKYYGTHKEQIEISVPKTLASGWYELVGKIISKDGAVLSENFQSLYITAGHVKGIAETTHRKLVLYDTVGKTKAALGKLGIAYSPVKQFDLLNNQQVLLIGENSADGTIKNAASEIKNFVENGGRVVCLKQDQQQREALDAIAVVAIEHLDADLDKATYPRPEGTSRNGYNINIQREGSDIFSGLDRRLLKSWNDYTNWDESKPGFPAIHPVTNGFRLAAKNDMGKTAIFANYGPGLNGIAIAEFFEKNGSLLLCGIDLVNRIQTDPVADKLLANLISYSCSEQQHHQYVNITEPIIWGDYESEKGILTGEISGLLLNPTPRLLANDKTKYKLVVTKEGHQFAGNNTIGWADLPGQQYIPYGRRPFGPYYLRGMGSIAELEKDADKNTGTGFFYCSVPASRKKAITKVWNPAAEPLKISIEINGQVTAGSIPANSINDVAADIKENEIKITFKGDRRLVLLQTSFE